VSPRTRVQPISPVLDWKLETRDCRSLCTEKWQKELPAWRFRGQRPTAKCRQGGTRNLEIISKTFFYSKNRELKYTFQHIELPAKLLDDFLRSNKSNINQKQANKKSANGIYKYYLVLIVLIINRLKKLVCLVLKYECSTESQDSLCHQTLMVGSVVWYQFQNCISILHSNDSEPNFCNLDNYGKRYISHQIKWIVCSCLPIPNRPNITRCKSVVKTLKMQNCGDCGQLTQLISAEDTVTVEIPNLRLVSEEAGPVHITNSRTCTYNKWHWV